MRSLMAACMVRFYACFPMQFSQVAGTALFPFPQGDLQQAMRDFKRASTSKNNGRPNVLGYVALAGLCYQQQQYKEALTKCVRACARVCGGNLDDDYDRGLVQ